MISRAWTRFEAQTCNLLKFQFFYGIPTPNALPASYFRQFYPRASYHPLSSTIESWHGREISIWITSACRTILHNPCYRPGKSAINYPGVTLCHSTAPLFVPSSQGWLEARYFLRRCAHARVARIRFKIPPSVY